MNKFKRFCTFIKPGVQIVGSIVCGLTAFLLWITGILLAGEAKNLPALLIAAFVPPTLVALGVAWLNFQKKEREEEADRIAEVTKKLRGVDSESAGFTSAADVALKRLQADAALKQAQFQSGKSKKTHDMTAEELRRYLRSP